MYKKILSFALVLMIILSCVSISVSAFSPPDPDIPLREKCKEAFMKELGLSTEDESYVWVPMAFDTKNYLVFEAFAGVSDVESCQYYDGYWFYSGSIKGDEMNNPVGMYTLDNYGNLQTLGKTLSEGFVEMDELFPYFRSRGADVYMVGDIDSDGKLTVKDATYIQKYLVGHRGTLLLLEEHPLATKVMDADLSAGYTEYYNLQGDVNVRDATYIQKKVAGLIPEVKEKQPFVYDEILVQIQGVDETEYTLEDFPEYNFTGIEVKRYQTLDQTVIVLEFEPDGKDGVINAVNSLKHRENEKLDVFPNWIMYAD